ncbi:MAG TPA: GNAT family N-acetyltransferase [Amnibacterium sp.]|jgi:ribosomal protein S18 acetylase RimI-like enzyme
MTPHIRRATSADADRAAVITRAAYSPWVPVIGREPAPMSADHAALAREGALWIADDDDGRSVGVLVLRAEPDHLLVQSVAVDPDAQRSGVGRALLAFAEQHALEAGLPELRLYTHERMTTNIALYERLGYRITRRAEQDGFARVHLAKRVQAKSASGADE